MVPAPSMQGAPLVEPQSDEATCSPPGWIQLAGLAIVSLEIPSSSWGILYCPLRAHC